MVCIFAKQSIKSVIYITCADYVISLNLRSVSKLNSLCVSRRYLLHRIEINGFLIEYRYVHVKFAFVYYY